MTSQLFLRIVLGDGGRTTFGAPGNKVFEHLFSNEGSRGPVLKKPIGSGLTRILIQGDSITWGIGVRGTGKTAIPSECYTVQMPLENLFQLPNGVVIGFSGRL